MKIDRSRVRKGTSDVPLECQQLIERLQNCSRTELLDELSRIHTWTFGKCELLHWASVLDIFDKILGQAAERAADNKYILKCDTYNEQEFQLLICILRFTSLLIEHSFSRHLYNSMEHLLVLLEANDMTVVLEVLNLLYMFSKRSNFITRLKPDEKECLLSRLQYLAESWGGKDNGFGLARCCLADQDIPPSATTLHVEFHKEEDSKTVKKDVKPIQGASKDEKQADSKVGTPNLYIIHIEHIDKLHKTAAEIMKSLTSMYYVPEDKEIWLFTHVRLATHFADYRNRLKNVQARLQALSVLVYSNAIQDSPANLLYNGILEELVEVVELQDPNLTDIKCAALRTLTAIIHLDRNPNVSNRRPGARLNSIIDVTGASQYHGFLPVLVRNCIASLTNQGDCGQNAFRKMKLQDEATTENAPSTTTEPDTPPPSTTAKDLMDVETDDPKDDSTSHETKFPVCLTTSLFSFLYHLASYEAGGEALVSCGMMESLLQVINWQGYELDHITFVTRAVRVIDLITNIDMAAFQMHGGLHSFINRLDTEVNLCKKEQLYQIKSSTTEQAVDDGTTSPSQDNTEESNTVDLELIPENADKTCLPQRAALLKSMLNFLKKAFQDSIFAESIRHLMEGTLPNSLKNIIANAEYYGPSLFLLATDVVTVYVYQEPALLSTLQDNGLTDVVLHSLLVKEIPATREVLGSLPNVFSALCLNNRGLESFAKYKPFEILFNILLSPNYLPAMRRRRSSEPTADTACNLGSAMDELMRHQPSLRQDATLAIIKLLEELVVLGTDPQYVCWRPHSKSEVSPSNNTRSPANTEGSSDEEEDDEEETSTSSQNAQSEPQAQASSSSNSTRTPVALIEYILNAMKFIDAILSNNSTDDHCREFVEKGGLSPLLKILGLPNLPVDCPVTNPAQAVATVCKSILNLAHEPFLFSQGLTQLGEVLETLKPLYTKQETPGGSKLLLELASASDIESAFSNAAATPLLHAMNAAHGYVIMFVHICRTGQTEIRNLSLQHWGSDSGMQVLKGLADLYTSLVWESTLLLAYCSDDLLPTDCDFTREDIEKLNAFFDRCEQSTAGVDCAGTVASAMEALSTNPTPLTMDVDGEGAATINTNRNLKYIKPLLGASSRLGRALAELFGLLVKLCVGSPIRQRRGQNMVAAPPIPSNYARNVATALNELLAEGLDCDRLPPCPTAKCRLTFLICSVGFTSPMLFDERRYPYHLMLKKFVSLGGLSIFFKTFKWAINAGKKEGDPKAIDHSSLPEGTLGFLDAWLTLLEKMVNPKAILESPHMISSRPIAYNFDPLNYLRHIHSAAFECVMLLWGISPLPNYGARTTDTLLTILRHIFRGEKIIKDKMKTDEKSDTASSSAAAGTSAAAGSSGNSGSNSNFRDLEDRLLDLRQLMDMGFSREHAIEALLHSHNLEQATDYILSNPAPMARVSMDVEEDDQVLQAIAISLGCTNTENKDNLDETESYESLIDEFTNHALDVCLKLLEVIPETVHKVCELLVTIMKRNGRVYRDSLLDTLISKIQECIADISFCTLEQEANVMSYYTMVDSDPAKCMSDYVHLYILFFEVSSYFDMKIPCGYAIHRAGLLEPLIELLCCAVKYMLFFKADHEPKWVAPSFLLLDAVSKVATCTSRKLNMHMSTTRTWRWYDLVTGKWTHYSTSNNKLINEAYWNGEQSIRVTCGRKRYTVTFANMLQMNDETGNNRPITMTLMSFNHPACIDINAPDYEPLYADLTEKEGKRCTPVPGLSLTQKQEIVKTCVKLMHMPIDKDLLHSALQICVRFTRDFSVAKVFVESGGIKCLLNMKQINDFGGFAILATILIRHALEEPSTLKYAMEKIIRGRTLSTIPPPYKDLIYLARNVGGAITRDPETFYEVASNIMRVDINVMKEEPVEASLPIRVEPPVRSKPPPMESTVSIGVVWDLLDALLRPLEEPVEDKHAEAKFGGQKLRVVVHEGLPSGSSTTSGTSASNMTQPSSTSGISTSDISCFESATTTSSQASQNSASQSSSSNNENAKTSGEPKKTEASKKPMLPKSVILKILADAVVSFGPIAKLITEYKYRAGYSEFITDDTSALAFIFDKILPGADNISDSDCSTMCRMLIAALASSNHSPDAQITLVSEVKVALTRALYLPESAEKHTQIQHICGIISTMIDNCPLPHASRWTSGSINNIVKLMIRRGVFSDLAKITHYLDLSSPNTSFTANAALKPLESLSRAINQPAPTSTQNKTKRNQHSNEDNNAVPSGTSTEATNAQGEEIEDAENTEHDISAVASSLENNAVGSGELDNALEEMMEHILEHRNNDNSQGYNDVPSSRNNTMDIDEECTIGGYDHERDATEELMSTDSGESDSNPSDQVDDEGNDDNEGDDDNMDDTEENEDTNYDDENNERERLRGSSGMFRIATNDRDEDILMIQYDADGESALPRMIRWNDNGFAVPLVDDSPNDHTGSVSVVTHPLLLSQSTSDSNQNPHARAHRANRARRYQYLFSPRNPNPPVILQRLLGPHDPHVTNIMSNNLLGGPTEIRESARVVVMDNFGIIPSNEEQIDFVDQSGYLFGPSLAATLSHIPPVLHWWNIESKLLDLESVNDCTIYVCNKLVPSLIKHRNEELRIKKAKEDEENAKKEKQKSGTEPQDEYSQETVLFNFEEAANTANENNEQNNEEEEENYDRVPIPETDRAETSAISADTPAEREDSDEEILRSPVDREDLEGQRLYLDALTRRIFRQPSPRSELQFCQHQTIVPQTIAEPLETELPANVDGSSARNEPSDSYLSGNDPSTPQHSFSQNCHCGGYFCTIPIRTAQQHPLNQGIEDSNLMRAPNENYLWEARNGITVNTYAEPLETELPANVDGSSVRNEPSDSYISGNDPLTPEHSFSQNCHCGEYVCTIPMTAQQHPLYQGTGDSSSMRALYEDFLWAARMRALYEFFEWGVRNGIRVNTYAEPLETELTANVDGSSVRNELSDSYISGNDPLTPQHSNLMRAPNENYLFEARNGVTEPDRHGDEPTEEAGPSNSTNNVRLSNYEESVSRSRSHSQDHIDAPRAWLAGPSREQEPELNREDESESSRDGLKSSRDGSESSIDDSECSRDNSESSRDDSESSIDNSESSRDDSENDYEWTYIVYQAHPNPSRGSLDLDEDEEFHHEDEDDAIDIDAIEADGLLDIFQSEGQNNDVDNSLLLDESDNFFPGSDELSDSSDDEDIDGVPVDPSIYRVPLETSEASNDRSEGNTQNDDIVLSPLQMRFDRGSNENSQSSMSEVTHNAAVQTSESSENVQRTEENSRPDSEISRDSDSSNPFEMTLPAYVRSTRPVMLPRDLLSQPPNDSMLLTEEETDTLTSRLREQLRDSLHNLEQPGSITLRAFLDDAVNSRLLPPQSEMDALVIRMAGEATANLEEAVQNSLDEMLQSSLAEALTHTLNEAIQNNFGDSSLNNFETASHRQEPIQNPNIVDEASTSTTANQGSAAADATSAASDANAPGESGEGDHSSAAPQAPGGAAANDNGNPHDEGAAAGLGDAGTPGAVTAAGPSSSVNDDEIPEGVDPSFLEALPPEMRREVLEQHRILCLQQRIAASAAANAANAAGAAGENTEAPSNEVSPEFLAALPPALQEEVLTQQRLEQQRQAAARANPNEPVDAGAFFETLQPSLRTMILSDMEDSQMSALPPDLAAEAQTLRRDWYARNRQMAQQRLFQSNLTTIYRHSRGRQSLRATNFQRGGWSQWNRDFPNNPTPTSAQMKIRGRQLLDHDGISCLLILLFTDDPHLNKLRLHRVIRNLCYHGPTREWIINALLSIIEKSVHTIPDENLNKPSRKGPKPGPLSSKLVTDSKHLQNGGHWLTIRTEAALGCAANVFIVNKTTGKKCDKPNGSSVIAIHPQAAPIICKNTLDLFTSLAKAFPSCLLPLKCIRDDNDKNIVQPIKVKSDSQSDFWDVLLRLDSATKKGKSIQKNNSSSNNLDSDPIVTFDQTVFGKLLNMLASPVVNSNTQLTDNLLKLLSVTTSGMPELVKPHKSGKVKNQLPDMSANPPTHALSLAVNVITYKNCSEEGLEFITNLLLNLANSSLDMSFLILTLLLNGAIEIGSIVENQIKDMLKDLKDLIVNSQKRKVEDGPSTSKGVIVNRFTNEQVVVTASTKVKTACELQLPSMVPLTSKCSSQTFFLRVLRVIVHIRNSIKNNLKKSDTWAHEMPALSEQLGSLKNLWDTLSECLLELEHAPDHHAVLVLQPAVEAFFLVHSPQQGPIKPKERQPDRQLDEEELMADNNEPEQQDQPAEQEQVQAQEQQPTQDGQDQETAPQAAQPQQPDHREDNTTAQIDMSETVHQEHVRLAEAKSRASVPPDQQQFLQFAEKHRTVLNQILRQSTAHLADGPFAVLVDHTRILDFDIKRRYFRTELERMDHGIRREETAVHVRRSNIFEDSFRELFRRPPEEWKNRFYIVFEDEEGQDAGGLLREWYVIISRDIFNPMYALFTVSPGDRVTYMINSASHYNSNHLCYYKFVGRVIAKAIYDNKLLECYFTRSFYKHILGIPVKYTDMESEDYSFYRGLIYLIENNINNLGLDLTFSTEISEFGVTETRDLIPNGRHINVTEENKMEYVRLVCQMKMTGAIKQQLNSFLEGFYDIIPMRLISIFNEQELELLISGLPNVDIDDLKANTEYHKYQTNSLQIQWFWRALRSFDQAERAKFLQFVTGTSKVPLQGFGALEGMNGVQKFQIHRDDRSTDRLPSAHTCFNQLDLPVYETYDKLRAYLLKAIHECSEGFGFA
ncbi:unnamed protein product [Acanthoscelides obtectus]|uniref:HECT-type E3 ubiquitin transferase n=1 Tax=Acanthoscelides obtectus TaxID=200917 RepID=A0A9P0NXD5_ACAOB|nr:unnamed protein product [Acanthoscelides obtectus]CAK1627955.1 E3 ubiquitin-protein ligase HUWE1 [Acanthoscelides obtectus]